MTECKANFLLAVIVALWIGMWASISIELHWLRKDIDELERDIARHMREPYGNAHP